MAAAYEGQVSEVFSAPDRWKKKRRDFIKMVGLFSKANVSFEALENSGREGLRLAVIAQIYANPNANELSRLIEIADLNPQINIKYKICDVYKLFVEKSIFLTSDQIDSAEYTLNGFEAAHSMEAEKEKHFLEYVNTTRELLASARRPNP